MPCETSTTFGHLLPAVQFEEDPEPDQVGRALEPVAFQMIGLRLAGRVRA